MTEPLVPAEVDLRGLPWMRLDTSRLLDSDLFALSTGDEFKAAVALWCKSWTQEPGGSLPKDDRILAHLSGAGSKWKRVKAMALRGWTECDDGRLYHPVVAEQAISAWEERVEFRREQDAINERKRKERDERKAMFEQLKTAGHDLAWNTPTGTLRDMCRDMQRDQSRQTVTPVTVTVTAMTGEGRDGTGNKSFTPESLTPTPAAPAVSGGSFEPVGPVRAAPNPAAPFAIALNRRGHRCTAINPELVAFVEAGGTVEHLEQVMDLPECDGKPVGYVMAIARRELAERPKTITTTARAGPNGNHPLSKTAQGIAALENLKRDAQQRLADGGDRDWPAEARVALVGPHSGG
jgi:hypothetical protein